MKESITVGRLAKATGLSRSTLLYYDRLGLLRPVRRSRGDYRLYSADEVERLRKIRCYRDAGIPLKQIPTLLADCFGSETASAAVLTHHVAFLDEQINTLRNQQRQVLALLQQLTSRSSAHVSGEVAVRRPRAQAAGRTKRLNSKENDMVNKDRWVEIMRAAGLSDQDMHNWHRQFERLEPEAHQEFLQSLSIPAAEIDSIRRWSQT
jgi:DNA-binding transcriptional MerR regulator